MARRRLRTFTLWTGATLCVLIAAAFVVSAWWEIAFQVPRPSGPAMSLMAGSVGFVTDDLFAVPVSAGSHSWGLSRWNAWTARRDAWVGAGNPMIPDIPIFAMSPIYYVHYLEIPLYAVFAAVAVPTILVWRFVPKPVKPGHCRCGYDLHGNESGVCPECGRGTTETR